MYQLIHYIVPLVLLVSALWLGLQEWSTYQEDVTGDLTAPALKRRRTRLLRRIVGSLLLVGIGFLVYTGDTNLLFVQDKSTLVGDPLKEKHVMECLNHWLAVLGLVAVAIALAFWDVVDGFRSLGEVLAESQRKELQILQEQITGSQQLLDEIQRLQALKNQQSLELAPPPVETVDGEEKVERKEHD